MHKSIRYPSPKLKPQTRTGISRDGSVTSPTVIQKLAWLKRVHVVGQFQKCRMDSRQYAAAPSKLFDSFSASCDQLLFSSSFFRFRLSC
jgi:hypothetical protein